MPLVLLAVLIFSIILYISQLKQKERSKQDELKLTVAQKPDESAFYVQLT